MRLIKFEIAFLTALFCLLISNVTKAEIKVVTTIKPLHSIVSSIMQGIGEPKLLMRSTISPHDYKLKASDVRALNQANVIFWFGRSLESRLSKAIQNAGRSVRVIELLKSPKIRLLESRTKEGEHIHEHALSDPHIWMSVENAKSMAFIISETLASVDPAHSKTYLRNYHNFVNSMGLLQTNIRRSLKSILNIPFIVYHDSFQYFEDEYRLSGRGAVMSSADHRPGAKRISNLRKLVKEKNIACIFSEPQYNQKILRSITKGSPAKIGELDSIGVKLEPGPGLYSKLMSNLSMAIRDCLERTP